MAYWLHENWTAKRKAVVHVGSCGHCNDGRGKTPNRLGEKSGRWHGPFPTVTAADQAAKATGGPARHHSCTW